MEVSDGSITIPHAEKCGYIEKLTKHGTVLSEVGSKDAAHIIPPYKWIELMRAELKAGSTYVIAEAREAGNVGIYRGSGEVREGLVQEILHRSRRKNHLGSSAKSTAIIFYRIDWLQCKSWQYCTNRSDTLETMRIGFVAIHFIYSLIKKQQNEAFWTDRISIVSFFFQKIFYRKI